jgi:hypothetical protein
MDGDEKNIRAILISGELPALAWIRLRLQFDGPVQAKAVCWIVLALHCISNTALSWKSWMSAVDSCDRSRLIDQRLKDYSRI